MKKGRFFPYLLIGILCCAGGLGAMETVPVQKAEFHFQAKRTPLPPLRFKGKPFFPLGVFDHEPAGALHTGALEEEFLASGGNILKAGNICHSADAEWKINAEKELSVVLELSRKDPRYREIALLVEFDNDFIMGPAGADAPPDVKWVPRTGADLEASLAEFAGKIRKISRYPNVLGYLLDEPENTVNPWFSRMCRAPWKKGGDAGVADAVVRLYGVLTPIFRKEHPGALRMPIIAWWSAYRHTAELYDVLVPDEYPKDVNGKEFASDLFNVNYDAAMAVTAARNSGGGRSVIYMPACFDNCSGGYHYNTLREQLYVNFAPITRGAMGIFAWRLDRASDFHRKAVVYPAMREVHALKEFLLGEWCDELVASDHDTATADYLKRFRERSPMVAHVAGGSLQKVENPVPDVSHCLRRHPDGRYCLIAVNNRREPLDVRFKVNTPRPPRDLVDNINKSDRLHVSRRDGGTFTVHFEPFGVHAYVW